MRSPIRWRVTRPEASGPVWVTVPVVLALNPPDPKRGVATVVGTVAAGAVVGAGRARDRRRRRLRRRGEHRLRGAGAARPAGGERAGHDPHDEGHRREGEESEPGCTRTRTGGQAGAEPQRGRDQHGHDARGGEDEDDPRRGVGAGPQSVQHGDRPAQVREPVDETPGPVPEPVAEQARDHQRDDQVEGQRAEPEPERSVRGDEGDHRVEHPDRRERVGDDHDHVHGDEGDDQQRDVAVDELDDEARPVRAAPAERREDPEQHAHREEHEADHSRGARHVPREGAPGDADHLDHQAQRFTIRSSGCAAPVDRSPARPSAEGSSPPSRRWRR